MLKKTVTFIDFDGVERTEDFYFNLTQAELTEMQLTTEGGLTKFLEKIIAEKDAKRITEYFKELVIKSYGEKSLDGRRFIKNQEVRDSFSQTQAYSDIFMELAFDAEKAAAFVRGIVPEVPKE